MAANPFEQMTNFRYIHTREGAPLGSALILLPIGT